MNLVAKEYVASRPQSDGVLILSETAGAASELCDAIIVNVNDRQEIADAILEALLMTDDDQKHRIKKMHAAKIFRPLKRASQQTDGDC